MSDRNTIAMPAGLIPGYDPLATTGDCVFDESAAQRAVDFFHECLTFTAGEWRGQPFILQPWQETIVRHLFGWKRPDGRRRYREAFIYVPRKNGKALALDTPIPTPTSFTSMGDIAVGDVVFDEHGLTTTVTHTSAVMHGRACYRVVFSDETGIVADADHLWVVMDRVMDGLQTLQTRDVADGIASRFAPRDGYRYSIAGPNRTRHVVAVEPAESVPVRCIAVNSPSRMYLAGQGGVPTHNSELAGGLGNLLIFADHEPGAQVYCAAADREQARLVFNAAKTMVLAEPEMAARAKVYTHAIVYEAGGCVLKVISAEAYSKHGINAHGIIVDELHAQPNRDLVDVLTTSTGARRQPLIVHITTADFDRESICNEKYDYARKVRDGVITDSAFLPVIYEATNEDDWRSPDVWRRVNPNLGVSVSMEYLERECRKAQDTPSYENTFKRLHLNIRTQQDIRWLSLEAWDACDGTPIDESGLEGKLCFAGLDLSTTTDLSALVLAFPDDDGSVTLLPRFWVPADNAAKRERRDRVPYQTWARQGFIEMTPGNVIDYQRIRGRFKELHERFKIREIAVDRWNATQLITELSDAGHRVVPFGQGFKDMTAPTKELEKLVISAKLRHGGNPVLRWMASHISVETDAAGNLKPSKKKSTDRIDGLVAAIMALGRLQLHNRHWKPGVKILWED